MKLKWRRETYRSWEGHENCGWWIAEHGEWRAVVYEAVGNPPTPSWKVYKGRAKNGTTIETIEQQLHRSWRKEENSGWNDATSIETAKRSAEYWLSKHE